MNNYILTVKRYKDDQKAINVELIDTEWFNNKNSKKIPKAKYIYFDDDLTGYNKKHNLNLLLISFHKIQREYIDNTAYVYHLACPRNEKNKLSKTAQVNSMLDNEKNIILENTMILITGQLNELFARRLIETYKNVYHKMISTWNNTNKEIIETLEKKGFIVLLNSDQPLKKYRITLKDNLQILCIKTGVEKAKELGYKHVLISRTDIFSNDVERFIKVNQNLYLEKIMVICGIKTKSVGVFFLDIIVAGPIEKILSMFILKKSTDRTPYEIYLLRNYTKKRLVTQDKMHEFFNFALPNCRKHRIELTWYRDAKWKTQKRSIPDMKIIKEYCDDDIMFC